MSDIQLLSDKAMRGLVESGKFEAIVAEAVEKSVKDAVKTLFRSYSDFSKELEAGLKTALKFDVADLGLHGYNNVVLQIVRQKLDAAVDKWGAKEIAAEMDKLLSGDVPAEIKLSALVEDFKTWARDDEGSTKSAVTVIVEEPEYSSRWIRFDKEPNRTKYECAFTVSIDDKTGEVRRLWLERLDARKTLFMGGLYGFRRTLFQMFTNKTRLIIDTDEPDIYHPDGD